MEGMDRGPRPTTQALTVGRRTRVVVLGGGFAGGYTPKSLTRLLSKWQDVEVELLSEENYFVFQPLLPEVAAGLLNALSDGLQIAPQSFRELLWTQSFRECREPLDIGEHQGKFGEFPAEFGLLVLLSHLARKIERTHACCAARNPLEPAS